MLCANLQRSPIAVHVQCASLLSVCGAVGQVCGREYSTAFLSLCVLIEPTDGIMHPASFVHVFLGLGS
jgi:uncharacterized protein involved in propanediol utilization